jgi:hypothetical protein
MCESVHLYKMQRSTVRISVLVVNYCCLVPAELESFLERRPPMPELGGRRAGRVLRRVPRRLYKRVVRRINSTGWMAGLQVCMLA